MNGIIPMKRAIVLFLSLAMTALAWGRVIAPNPLPLRLAEANAVFLGRFIGFEDQEVAIEPFPNAKETEPYRVATVVVIESIKGPKANASVRMGIPAVLANDSGEIRMGRGATLKTGQDGIFLLHQHPSGKFYQSPSYGDFIRRDDANFNIQLREIKSTARAVENPRSALESNDVSDRLNAAYSLLRKYNTPVAMSQKREAIDAKESQLIVEAILLGFDNRRFGEIDGMSLFHSLELTPQDGFHPPELNAPAAYQAFVKEWLEKNKGTYRIKKYVP